MNVLITGATGFIGTNLANSLASRGYRVKALIRSPEKAGRVLDTSRITCVKGDITDVSSLETAIERDDIVLHLAARYNDAGASYEMYRETNVIGTENLVKVSMAKSVKRFIHCSTIGVLIGSSEPPYDETSPYSPAPDSAYELTKCEAERLVLRYCREKGFPAVVVRPVQPFGPGDTNKVKFYKLIRKGVVVGNGNIKKHLIYIDDLVNGFERVIHKEGIEGEIFIIGGNPVITLNEMIEWAASALNVKKPWIRIPVSPMRWLSSFVEGACKRLDVRPPLYKSRLDFFTKSYYFNTEKAERVLGFRAQVQIRDGISKTVAWYQKNDLL